jgi:sterol 24-C-methyltransferase
MFKMDLDARLYTDERVDLATKFSDPHHRVVATEETAATYDLIGEMYVKGGWGSRFHFAPQARAERMDTALIRWERFLALSLGAGPGMRLLDVGSGVGGPACDVARMTGASVLGIDLSRTEVESANRAARETGLGHLCEFQVGDFNDLSRFPDGSFDGVYSFRPSATHPTSARRTMASSAS